MFITIIIFSQVGNAEVGKETGLEIPRYVSLKSNDANIRVGPSMNYPIEIKYVIKNYPFKVLEEYKDWRKVEDFKKNIGWIHKSLISGTRTGIVLSKDNHYVELLNTLDGDVIGEIGKDNIVNLEKCKTNWCLVSGENFQGWMDKKYIWGVKQNEIIKISFLQIFEDLYWKSINSLSKLQKEF
ncbi:SH3 domain-containing protein [Pelagibacteraceae bacterium]|nr:SH3 domain-containing protein [Pelagibacteraceae bacterium]